MHLTIEMNSKIAIPSGFEEFFDEFHPDYFGDINSKFTMYAFESNDLTNSTDLFILEKVRIKLGINKIHLLQSSKSDYGKVQISNKNLIFFSKKVSVSKIEEEIKKIYNKPAYMHSIGKPFKKLEEIVSCLQEKKKINIVGSISHNTFYRLHDLNYNSFKLWSYVIDHLESIVFYEENTRSIWFTSDNDMVAFKLALGPDYNLI
jgi:hypothetical protein